MGPDYSPKQPKDGVAPQVPCTGIFLEPSKSGKTVAIISATLEQYRTFIFSPSIEIDDGWKPVKEFIQNEMGVNTETKQVYFDKWDEGALRTIIVKNRALPGAGGHRRLRRPAGAAPEDGGRCPGHPVHPRPPHAHQHAEAAAHQRGGPRQHAVYLHLAAPESAKAGAVLEELSALLPKQELLAMYQEATREPYSFWFIY